MGHPKDSLFISLFFFLLFICINNTNSKNENEKGEKMRATLGNSIYENLSMITYLPTTLGIFFNVDCQAQSVNETLKSIIWQVTIA